MNPIGPMANFPSGFANGLSVRGMPLLQMQPGAVFFLDNNPVMLPQQHAGSDGNRGTFLDPFATLNYAVNTACVPGRGDIVFVGPGHRETISSATIATLNNSGVAVVGLGAGNMRPTFTFTTATAANIPVQGSNISIQNCLFIANFAAVASVFTSVVSSFTGVIDASGVLTASVVTGSIPVGGTLSGTGVTAGTVIQSQLTGTAGAAGTYQTSMSSAVTSTSMKTVNTDFAIDACEFRDTSSSLNFVTVFTGDSTANSADGFSMTRCRISSLGTTSATTAVKANAAEDRWTINDNFGNWAILNDTACMVAAGSSNLTNFEFGRNVLQKPNTSSTGGSFVSGSGTAWTGHAHDNYMYQLDGSSGIWIPTGTGGAFGFSNNFSPITGATDKSGLINPAAA